MAANVFMRSFVLSDLSGTQRVSGGPLKVTAVLVASSANTGPIEMRYQGGPWVSVNPGVLLKLGTVDAYDFELQFTGVGTRRALFVGTTSGESLGYMATQSSNIESSGIE